MPGGGGGHLSPFGESLPNHRRLAPCPGARLWRVRRSPLSLLEFEVTTELGPRLSQRRGDGSLCDSHHVGDLRVGEIGEVAEEDSEPPPWRERLHSGPDILIRAAGTSRHFSIQFPLAPEVSARLERHVERDPPDPGLQAPLAAKSTPVAQCAREGVLNDLTGEVVASDHTRENVTKRSVTVAVELLKCLCVPIHLQLLILT